MKEDDQSLNYFKSLVNKKGWLEIPSTGISMYPLIKKGDVCCFVPINGVDTMKKGDVILYMCDDGRLIGHRYHRRFIENDVDYYLLKGDTNHVYDPPIKKHQLIGKLKTIKRRKYAFRAECLLFKLWTSVVMAFPVLPRHCIKIISIKTRMNFSANRLN